MYGDFKLRIYDPVLDNMLNSTSGDVGRYMRRIATEIITGAKAIVPVRSGHLRASIHLFRQDRWARGQLIEVGSKLHYAYLVHEGSKPHVIMSNTGRLLVFKDHGKIVHSRRVNHPGFRGRKYLTVPMERAVRR
jgi:hypothetical protein